MTRAANQGDTEEPRQQSRSRITEGKPCRRWEARHLNWLAGSRLLVVLPGANAGATETLDTAAQWR